MFNTSLGNEVKALEFIFALRIKIVLFTYPLRPIIKLICIQPISYFLTETKCIRALKESVAKEPVTEMILPCEIPCATRYSRCGLNHIL